MRAVWIPEALRIFLRSLRVKQTGWKRYSGSDEEICQKIISDCWNGRYFMASAGHFCEFWTRDFGWCCEALVKLGYKDRVKETLRYALSRFRRQGRTMTTISPSGVAFDFPTCAADSLPYLVRSLRILGDAKLIAGNALLLNKEVQRFYELVIDRKTGLVKRGHFSSMKDHAIRQSSCYDNCMAAMLKEELERIGVLDNPLAGINYKKLIIENFWTDSYFLDDLSGSRHIAGDAQIIPFYAGVVEDKEMWNKCLKAIKKEGLDRPLPLRYSREPIKGQKYIGMHWLTRNYEKNTAWAHIGMMFLEVLAKYDRKMLAHYMEQYKKVIEKNRNFLEVYNPDGTPYNGPFYFADEGMLWASIYLALRKDLAKALR